MPLTGTQNSFDARQTLEAGGKSYTYYSLPRAAENGLNDIGGDIGRLPFSLKVLLENMLRFEDGSTVTADDIRAFGTWLKQRKSTREIAYRPARVLMQDFTGVPAVVDLAAMRDAIGQLGGDPEEDQSAGPRRPRHRPFGDDRLFRHAGRVPAERRAANSSATASATSSCAGARQAFDNFRVVPPGTGICHQVNLEYLAQTVWTRQDERRDRCLSRHLRRHRQPHDDGERPRRCSAGASAASRRKRRCSASPSRC